MRSFSVAGGILHSPSSGDAYAPNSVLLVCNRRRDGRIDWTPPGGIIDAGEQMLEGLTREVEEETALVVGAWGGELYRVSVEFAERQFALSATVHEAAAWSGDLHVDDPDGVVVDAEFASVDRCRTLLGTAPRWVQEPMGDWLSERWSTPREYHYRVVGSDATMKVHRIDP